MRGVGGSDWLVVTLVDVPPHPRPRPVDLLQTRLPPLETLFGAAHSLRRSCAADTPELVEELQPPLERDSRRRDVQVQH